MNSVTIIIIITTTIIILVDLNMELLTAQCFVFFVAGFETSSNSLTFILYELAKHPHIQQKVHEEVDRVLKKYDEKITYDSVQEMHYMDKVFNGKYFSFFFIILYNLLVELKTTTCTYYYCQPCRIKPSDKIIGEGEEELSHLPCQNQKLAKLVTPVDKFTL